MMNYHTIAFEVQVDVDRRAPMYATEVVRRVDPTKRHRQDQSELSTDEIDHQVSQQIAFEALKSLLTARPDVEKYGNITITVKSPKTLAQVMAQKQVEDEDESGD